MVTLFSCAFRNDGLHIDYRSKGDTEMTRTAKTKSGKTVQLNKAVKVDGGIVEYVMHRRGYAVAVFVPC
jgi:hypothetical protein